MDRPRTPLEDLFRELVWQVFAGPLQTRDHALLLYLAAMLAEFAHRDRLYRLRDARQRPLEQVAAMLREGDLLLDAGSLDREWQVHKHIGDFTLFVTGIWPEWHARLGRSGQADALLDYPATGRHSYYVASTFQHGPYRAAAPVLRRLSEDYELCRFGLNLVRAELDRLGQRPSP
ncbi:MAG: hypothetical protein HUU35_07390 [Armatimonadetes bacterium]|nr:hypothetical protein [Armatimonadota bacterium]